jgi:hypothetical protein
MKNSLYILIAFLLLSCKTEVKKENLTKLNGYWEIKEVTLANGETKDYKVNETIDFFEVKDQAGYRQKVMPQLDGTYKTNGIKENLKVFQVGGTYFLECKTDYGKWNEEIITIEDSTLVLKNTQNLIYTYKKYQPFSLK